MSPRNYALHLLAPFNLVADLLVAEDGAQGGYGTAANLGWAAEATEPVAVTVSTIAFFSAAPTPDRTWPVLESEWEGLRPGRR